MYARAHTYLRQESKKEEGGLIGDKEVTIEEWNIGMLRELLPCLVGTSSVVAILQLGEDKGGAKDRRNDEQSRAADCPFIGWS